MRQRFLVMVVGAALMVLPVVATAQAADPAELVKKMFDGLPDKAFSTKVKMTSDRGWTRDMNMLRQNIDGVDKIYLEVTAPNDLKDTRFLLIDRLSGKDEQQMYVPQLKRVVLLNNETRKQEFLGSDFLVADLVRPDLDAYTYALAGEETIAGRACTKVDATPKSMEGEIYSKFRLAIDPKDNVGVRIEYFDKAGQPLKTLEVTKIETIDGEITPVMQRMTNLQTKHTSQMELVDMKYGAELPGDAFSKTYLTR